MTFIGSIEVTLKFKFTKILSRINTAMVMVEPLPRVIIAAMAMMEAITRIKAAMTVMVSLSRIIATMSMMVPLARIKAAVPMMVYVAGVKTTLAMVESVALIVNIMLTHKIPSFTYSE